MQKNEIKYTYLFLIAAKIPIKIDVKIIEIHKGLVTHHQLQLICFVSFSTKKIKNKTVGNDKKLLLSFML